MAASRSAKSSLFEYCQKRKIGPPCFETWAAANGYQAKVILDGYPYPASGMFSKKKEAEHDAARACLASLGIFLYDNNGGLSGQNEDRGNEGYQGTDPNSPSSFGTPSPSSNFSTPRPLDRPPRSGSSGGTGKMPKSVLHEFCQAQKMSLPQYETEASYDGNTLLGFHCVLFVKDEYFTTDRLYTNKREAEHAVARKALNVFGYYTRSPLYVGSTLTHQPQSTPSFKTPETSYKNLLQEHLQQRNIDPPSYETQLTDGGYFSKVTIEDKVFKAKECCQTKKLAEQYAAKAGLVAMGVKDPEQIANRLLRKNSRGQFQDVQAVPFKKDLRDLEPDQLETDQVQGNASWVHSRKQSDFDVDDYDNVDGAFTDFQKAAPVELKRKLDESVDFLGTPEQRPNKYQRTGELSSEKRPRRRGEYEVEDVHLGNLSVGEAWPEKRNVVIVGSEETSIPLFCQASMERCALEDMSCGQLVDIVPGTRLVGLEGYYVVRGGQIVLRAQKCQQVVMPEKPDKVLISCGVVVLHCIPRRDGDETRCDVNILLKRYLCSQAFINVVRGLAQYFRCKQSNRPFTLNKDMIVVHIKDWMLEEVMAIASFSETALENVFQHTMKFDKRWVKYLKDEELSQELRDVQAAANQELFRRANSNEDQNQDKFRPWRLPKGNFYHRVLTTGVFIESPAEAAMRELKEETGIKLKLSDISSSPYVDLLQTDNLNPHKGDYARYYLCGIITEAESHIEEVEEEKLGEVPAAENQKETELALVSADQTSTETVSSYAGSNYASAGTNAAITSSTYNDAYAANVAAGYSANPGAAQTDTFSAYGSASSTHGPGSTSKDSGYTGTGYSSAGAYLAYSNSGTTNAGTNMPHGSTQSTFAGANTTNTDTNAAYNSTYSPQQGRNNSNAAYSAYTGTSSSYPGTNSSYGSTSTTYTDAYLANSSAGSINTNTSSVYASAYSAYANAYSANAAANTAKSANTGPTDTDKRTTPANTNPTFGSAGSANTGTDSTHTGSSLSTTSTNAGAYSASTDSANSSSNSVGTVSINTTTNTNTSPHHDAYSGYTDPAFSSKGSATTGKEDPPPPGLDQSASTQEDTTTNPHAEPVKEEESAVIRSPLIAGAVHEECKWFDMDEAKEISTVFLDIYNTPEFQKLIAKLKGVVSAM